MKHVEGFIIDTTVAATGIARSAAASKNKSG
jgi:hypothetical protein